jgi:cytochrome c peroxidase
MFRFFLFLFVIVAVISCSRKEIIRGANNQNGPENDLGFPVPVYKFENNIPDEKKFQLGRQLFYEKSLSADGTISCASCHKPASAFSDVGHKISEGIHQLTGLRNAPGLFNLAWHPQLMHDGAVSNIEMQPLAPIANEKEMGSDLRSVLNFLSSSPKYVLLFETAFGSKEINSERFLKSLAQFLARIESRNSKYDRFKKEEVNFSDAELRGYNFFRRKCSACHVEPLFSDFKFRNNGLDAVTNDSGRARITKLSQDLYKFKTPSLRNVALTFPYMHDGRYKDLATCLAHYNAENVLLKNNADPLLMNGIKMTEDEKNDLILFLHTLTDSTFINDPALADPN